MPPTTIYSAITTSMNSSGDYSYNQSTDAAVTLQEQQTTLRKISPWLPSACVAFAMLVLIVVSFAVFHYRYRKKRRLALEREFELADFMRPTGEHEAGSSCSFSSRTPQIVKSDEVQESSMCDNGREAGASSVDNVSLHLTEAEESMFHVVEKEKDVSGEVTSNRQPYTSEVLLSSVQRSDCDGTLGGSSLRSSQRGLHPRSSRQLTIPMQKLNVDDLKCDYSLSRERLEGCEEVKIAHYSPSRCPSSCACSSIVAELHYPQTDYYAKPQTNRQPNDSTDTQALTVTSEGADQIGDQTRDAGISTLDISKTECGQSACSRQEHCTGSCPGNHDLDTVGPLCVCCLVNQAKLRPTACCSNCSTSILNEKDLSGNCFFALFSVPNGFKAQRVNTGRDSPGDTTSVVDSPGLADGHIYILKCPFHGASNSCDSHEQSQVDFTASEQNSDHTIANHDVQNTPINPRLFHETFSSETEVPHKLAVSNDFIMTEDQGFCARANENINEETRTTCF